MEERAPLEAPARKGRMTPEELELERKHDALLLSRSRVLQDLESSSNPRYRSYLEQALAHLEKQIANLERGGH
jgi:hypothetical protein